MYHEEAERLAALRAYQAMDTPPEPCFDRLTRAAAHLLGTPLAFLTLVDQDRAFIKSSHGFESSGLNRGDTLCTHVVEARKLLVFPDTRLNDLTKNSRYVVNDPGIRFYAGAPLITPAGFCIGSICGVDIRPKSAPAEGALKFLQDLADEAIEQIEHRLAKKKLLQSAAALEARERALRSSEEMFRGLSLSCPAGIFRAELDGHVTYINPTAMAIWGMPEQEMLGFGWAERVHPEDKERLVSGWIEANSKRQDFGMEYRLRMPDGTIRWVHGRSAIILGEHGDTIVGTVDDITSRKESIAATEAAKAEAEEANRAKDLFLANVSHELRTPLNGILGMSELLLQSSLDAKAKECAEMIQSSGRTLLCLVNDVLDTGKIAAGTLTIETMPFDLKRCVEMAANYVRQEVDSKGLTLSLEVDSCVPASLVGDGSRIQQILVNFLTNAVKFTDKGGVQCRVLCKRVTTSRYKIVLEVIDTGAGIAAELQDKLFKPFSQVDSSNTRKQRGVGLGLSICRRLAELMGGSVGVKSALGEGSTFWLELDLSSCSETATIVETAKAPAEIYSHEDGKRGRILVAEDNPINQRVVSRMLERLGWQVDIAPDGVRAFALAQENRYSLVLMDCLMPEADGYTATSRIREHERANGLPRLPIVALTANALSGDRERCLSVGMDDYLSKPLQLHLLKEILERWDLKAAGAEVNVP